MDNQISVNNNEIKEEVINVDYLKQSINSLLKAAFLCEINPKNPHYLKVIHCNPKFIADFGLEKEQVLGNNYDFLFQNLDVDYVSDDQFQYTKLLKAVKNFQPIAVNINIPSPSDKTKSESYTISFSPNDFKAHNNLYCIFTFEKLITVKEDVRANISSIVDNVSAPLIKNLERTLRNERLLRSVSDLIVSDESVKDIATKIAKILCEHLKADRCVLHDYNEGETRFVVEHHNQFSKPIISEDEANRDLKPITEYINFQNHLFGNFNTVKKRNTTIICDDIPGDLRFRKIEETCEKFSIKSQIAIITAVNDKINGGLYIHQSYARKWSIEEVELVELIANQFSIAIDRSYSTDKVMIANHQLLEKTLELKKALKEEKRIRQMQNEFVAMASHEFKTPLQIIDATREVISRKLKSLGVSEESLIKSLDKIKTAVFRMNGLIQSTLNLSKMEMSKGMIQVNKQNFEIKNLIKDIVEKNSLAAIEKNIKVEIDIDNLPEIFNGDPKLLDHCFTNMVTNAIKYSKKDSVVKVIGDKKENNVLIKTIDQGIGIPKEDLTNIGKKFFRAGNTLAVAGTGIGLYLTKYFVELHGGLVLIESEVNVGTTVTTSLPIL